ncbi:MAG: hypothetical protein DMD81_23220 [Candidatus Rokuibacteriota bacterium]|nr:MAG: hypothetical protein DMD81_23220 [Candidatus Rokubacteria bacterium]
MSSWLTSTVTVRPSGVRTVTVDAATDWTDPMTAIRARSLVSVPVGGAAAGAAWPAASAEIVSIRASSSCPLRAPSMPSTLTRSPAFGRGPWSVSAAPLRRSSVAT